MKKKDFLSAGKLEHGGGLAGEVLTKLSACGYSYGLYENSSSYFSQPLGCVTFSLWAEETSKTKISKGVFVQTT
jgi:hypothetical protein